MGAIQRIFRIVFHLAVVWIVDTLSLIFTAALLSGFNLYAVNGRSVWVVAAAGALALGLVNLLIRPALLLLALPFGFFFIFGAGFLVNALVLLIASSTIPGFEVDGILWALAASLVLSIINTILSTIFDLDGDSFYNGVVERLAKRQKFVDTFGGDGDDGMSSGLVMVEIDGLSWHHLKKAIADGTMPTLKKMMKDEGYVITRVDCGLPSQTSSCQAGIMFGNNFDIPAYRWFDKEKGKLYVSASDAAELNSRYAGTTGLMRGGSSINNMLNGDAQKSLFTLANIRTGSAEEQERRAQDVYLLMMNPYFFMRTLVLFLGDALLDVWQGLKQTVRNVQPRLNRLAHFYPFVRAATTVFMREIPIYFVSLDVMRGSPAIYYTFPGYDEVAHHSGPWTSDAMHVLRQFDRVIGQLKDLIERKGARPYELVVLSDHGQSFGATFKMRYGVGLKEFIEQYLPQGMQVMQSNGGDDGTLSVGALATELEVMQAQKVGGRVGRAVTKRTARLVRKGVDQQIGVQDEGRDHATQEHVIAYGSGNLAQVYFNQLPGKVVLSELNAEYPGLVDALIDHEGIGCVVGYDDDGVPIALSKSGTRNLHTGVITGEDPLRVYADERATADFRAAQVHRVMDFPHAGDLMVISCVYPDGTVAAFEELIGSHGGVGGEQTDAFLFHPKSWGEISPTSNSSDVFHILNARRGRQETLPQVKRTERLAKVSAWSVGSLTAGLAQVGRWLSLTARTLGLDRRAYREVAGDPLMTGPAVLIGLVGTTLASLLDEGRILNLPQMLVQYGLWFVLVLSQYLTARALGSKATYTDNLRVSGFSRSAYLLVLLMLIPPLAPIAPIMTLIVVLFGIWIGAAEANHLQGWRSALLPVMAFVVIVIGRFALQILFEGAEFTLDALLRGLGLGR